MLIDKENLPLVAMDFMNEVHLEDVEMINTLYEATLLYESEASEKNYESIARVYEEWFAHTIEHFKNEELKMQEMRFPPYPMHKGEHDIALERMDRVYQEWRSQRDISKLKKYLRGDMLPWLIRHIESMDRVTASFFKTGLSPCSLA